MLRWFHPLLDARGADRLLAALDEASRGETPALEGRLLPSASTGGSSFLSSWRAFRAARALLDGEAGEAPVPLASRAEAPRRLRVAPFALGPEESAAEARASRELFGGIGANEHLLSASFRAAHRFQEERGAPKGPYALPVAVGLRAPGAAGPVLGNRLTFLHLRASAAEVSDRRALARAIRDQEVRLLRAGVDRAMGTLLRAGRWLPLRRYERERRRPDGGPRETVWFSNVGELLPGRDRWFGERIVGACVATAVPHPPGALFLFFRRAGNLAGSVVFAEGPFLREDARRLAEILREELVALP